MTKPSEKLYQAAFIVAREKLMKARGHLSVSLFVNVVQFVVIFMFLLGMHK